MKPKSGNLIKGYHLCGFVRRLLKVVAFAARRSTEAS